MRSASALWSLKAYSVAQMCFLAVLIIIAGLTARTMAGDGATPIAIAVRDNAFDPNAVVSAPGKAARITFHKSGAIPQVVQIVGLTDQTVIQPGQSATFTVTPQPRQYAIVDALGGALPVVALEHRSSSHAACMI
jgi:hypothetical protein